MKEIKAYKTTEGKIFENKHTAEKEENKYKTRESLKEFFYECWYDGIELDELIDEIENRLIVFKSIINEGK